MFLVVAFSVNLIGCFVLAKPYGGMGVAIATSAAFVCEIGAVVPDRQAQARHPPVRLAGRLEQDPERIMLEKKVFYFEFPKERRSTQGFVPYGTGFVPYGTC